MKNKVYELIKKMESDGWELITLDSNTLPRGLVTWFSILRKEDLHIYIEIEKEENMWLRDIALECPKCGMMYSENDHGDFCPDCEVAWDWKKEVPADYK